MGKIEPLAPSKRVRIVLCSAVVAIFAVAPGAGLAAEWSSGKAKPGAEWSSGKVKRTAEWSSGKRGPKAEWSSAEWSSGKVKRTAEWSSRYSASALR